LRDSYYIDIVKTCIRDTLSEYYSGGDIDDFLHVEEAEKLKTMAEWSVL
jgi:hypothetical protein